MGLRQCLQFIVDDFYIPNKYHNYYKGILEVKLSMSK